MVRYPPAVWLGDGKSGGSWLDVPKRLVIHTTETAWLPAYNGGASSPHLTYLTPTRQWFQHLEINQAARALRNLAGGVQTNRQAAIQIEIVCYSNKALADAHPDRRWVGDLLPEHLDDIAGFASWCVTEFGVQPVWPGRQALSYSAANTPGFRLSDGEWETFGGIIGHQHIPENTHWDPGALDWPGLMERLETMTPEQEAALDWLVELKATLEGFGWTDGDNSAKRVEYANRLRNGFAAETGISGDNGPAIAAKVVDHDHDAGVPPHSHSGTVEVA